MLAMVVNDDVGCLNARGVWATIASMLAPTGCRASVFLKLPATAATPPDWCA